MSTLLKICGLTRERDVRAAADAGADFIGVVIAPGSPRRVADPDRVRELFAAAPRGVGRVLVTAGIPLEDLQNWIDRTAPDAIQLHGDESPEFARELRGAAVWRAFHPSAPEEARIAALFPCEFAVADAVRGGSGRRCDWAAAALLARWKPDRMLLAGGIRPENAVEALARTGAAGIDVSGGVEDAPGIKSKQKIELLARRIGK